MKLTDIKSHYDITVQTNYQVSEPLYEISGGVINLLNSEAYILTWKLRQLRNTIMGILWSKITYDTQEFKQIQMNAQYLFLSNKNSSWNIPYSYDPN